MSGIASRKAPGIATSRTFYVSNYVSFPLWLHLSSNSSLAFLLLHFKNSQEKYEAARKIKKHKKNKGIKRKEWAEKRWGKKRPPSPSPNSRDPSPEEDDMFVDDKDGSTGSKDLPVVLVPRRRAPPAPPAGTPSSAPSEKPRPPESVNTENPTLGYDSDEEFARLHKFGKAAKQELRVKVEKEKEDLAEKLASFPDVSP